MRYTCPISVHGCLELPQCFVKLQIFHNKTRCVEAWKSCIWFRKHNYFGQVGLGCMRPTYSLEHEQRVGKPRDSNR